jgi:hypothetical protein
MGGYPVGTPLINLDNDSTLLGLTVIDTGGGLTQSVAVSAQTPGRRVFVVGNDLTMVSDGGVAVDLNGVGASQVLRNHVGVNGVSGAGIRLENANATLVRDNVVSSHGAASPGIVLRFSSDIEVTANRVDTVHNTADGILFTATRDGAALDNVVTTQGFNARGIVFEGASGPGVSATSPYAFAARNQVTTRDSSAIEFSPTVTDGTISGNRIQSEGNGVTVRGAVNATVSGNTFGTVGLVVIDAEGYAGFNTSTSTGNSWTDTTRGRRCGGFSDPATNSGTVTFVDGTNCVFPLR